MNSLSISKDRLIESVRQLENSWNIAKGVWNDAAREAFEREVWAEVEMTTVGSINKLQELIHAVAQAEREIP